MYLFFPRDPDPTQVGAALHAQAAHLLQSGASHNSSTAFVLIALANAIANGTESDLARLVAQFTAPDPAARPPGRN